MTSLGLLGCALGLTEASALEAIPPRRKGKGAYSQAFLFGKQLYF
jgi:hypothetical protein